MLILLEGRWLQARGPLQGHKQLKALYKPSLGACQHLTSLGQQHFQTGQAQRKATRMDSD